MVNLPTRKEVYSEIRDRAQELNIDLNEEDIHIIRDSGQITVEINRERIEAYGRLDNDEDRIKGVFRTELRDVYDRDIEVAFGVNISDEE